MFWKTLVIFGVAFSVVLGDGAEKVDDSKEASVFKDIEQKEINKHFTYPPCQACKKMIESFNRVSSENLPAVRE